ncbi:DUF3203 family protein [Pseudomonas borbori]
MTISIDPDAGTCVIDCAEGQQQMLIRDVVISTDKNLRASVIRTERSHTIVTEDEIDILLAAGAKDDRQNLVYDGG